MDKTILVFWVVVRTFATAIKPPETVLKPGALTASIGTIVVVKDVVTIRISLTELPEIASKLVAMGQQITKVRTQLLAAQRPHIIPPLRVIITNQMKDLNSLEGKINRMLKNLPVFRHEISRAAHAHRVKRGLFNFAGIISKSLFGTATQGDIDTKSNKLQLVTKAVSLQKCMIEQTYESLAQVKDQVQTLGTHIKAVEVSVNQITAHLLPSMEMVQVLQSFIQSTHNFISEIKEGREQLITDLVDASLGTVTSRLLSLENLRKALGIARVKYSLRPLFSELLAAYYYPLLESTLTDTDILVHIPMKSTTDFRTTRIIPFPWKVDDKLVMVDLVDTLMVYSRDYSKIDISTPSVLENCKVSYFNLYVCPAWAFAFIKSDDALCELSLITSNASRALKLCHYRTVNPSLTYHVHFQGQQYFYFPREVGVSLLCQGVSDKQSYNTIAGYYAAPDYCEINSKKLYTLATRHHFALNVDLTEDLVQLESPMSINLSVLQIHTAQLDLLNLMNTTKLAPLVEAALPVFLHQHVYLPFGASTIGIILFLVGLVVAVHLKSRQCYNYLQGNGARELIKIAIREMQEETARQDNPVVIHIEQGSDSA